MVWGKEVVETAGMIDGENGGGDLRVTGVSNIQVGEVFKTRSSRGATTLLLS